YYFNSSDNNTISNMLSEYVTTMGTVFGDVDTDAPTDSRPHSLHARIQYAIGPRDQLVISPSVGFTTGGRSQVRASLQRGVIQQDQTTNSTNQTTTPSIGGNVLYNHLFDNPGRNYSLNMGARSNGVDNIDNNVNWIKYYSPGTGALEKDSLDRRLNQ